MRMWRRVVTREVPEQWKDRLAFIVSDPTLITSQYRCESHIWHGEALRFYISKSWTRPCWRERTESKSNAEILGEDRRYSSLYALLRSSLQQSVCSPPIVATAVCMLSSDRRYSSPYALLQGSVLSFNPGLQWTIYKDLLVPMWWRRKRIVPLQPIQVVKGG
jgi:hypothetical protein